MAPQTVQRCDRGWSITGNRPLPRFLTMDEPGHKENFAVSFRFQTRVGGAVDDCPARSEVIEQACAQMWEDEQTFE